MTPTPHDSAPHDTPTQDLWDSRQYLRHAGLRARPFRDLLAQVHHEAPRTIVDLGCGPGNATELITQRWPAAHVTGIDSSTDMITAARVRARPGRLDFEQADLRDWATAEGEPVDVILANAVLQWVPGHRELLPHLARRLAPHGVLGFQVPGNFSSPSHTTLKELVSRPYWHARLADVAERPANHDPINYLATLSESGLDADAWETTYTYVLDLTPDETPDADETPAGVTRFVSGTALRPYLTRLDAGDRRRLLAEYDELARVAYPPTRLGERLVQIVPYRRVFATGRRVG